MNQKEIVKYLLDVNDQVIKINISGITHENSLTSASSSGSNINWILGHLLVSRDMILNQLTHEPLCEPSMKNLYDRGTAPVTPEMAVPFDTLTRKWDDSHQILTKTLDTHDMENMDIDRVKIIVFLAYHETYHIGQLGLLRRCAGLDGGIR